MELISHAISDLILSIAKLGQIFYDNMVILGLGWQQILFDIILVAIIFYFLINLIKGSRAVHILIGLSMMGLAYFLSRTFQLVALAWLLEKTLTIILVAIPIIFQQELRTALERIGHAKIIPGPQSKVVDRMIAAVVEATESLAKRHEGALIVFQQTVPLKEYIESGILIGAAVTKELIMSIFNHTSPLHDGAIVISDSKIAAAACILPHSAATNSAGMMGTRHKSALGLSESTDAIVIVVSEEKGIISLVRAGNMRKNISADELRKYLVEKLNQGKPKPTRSKPKKT